MKELSIEEKAKAYDNIIEKANKMHSEDERIRKYLLTLITSIWADTIENYGGVTKEEALAGIPLHIGGKTFYRDSCLKIQEGNG